MNSSFYKRGLSLLLASCMALGGTASAISSEAVEKIAQDAVPWVEEQEEQQAQADQPVMEAEGTNLAEQPGVTAEASNQEIVGSVRNVADNVKDGKMNTRWATTLGAQSPWIKLSFGKLRQVQSVVIYWEKGFGSQTATPDEYEIQVSTAENPTQPSDWVTKATRRTKPAGAPKADIIDFGAPVDARHIRVHVKRYSNGGRYNNVSMYELQAYQEKFVAPVTPEEIIDDFQFRQEENRFIVSNIPDGYAVEMGANYEQVVGGKLAAQTAAAGEVAYELNKPLVDMNVELDFTVTHGDTTGKKTRTVKIEGQHPQNDGNKKPGVIPEMTEWYSTADQSGQKYTLGENPRIVADAALSGVADELKKDLKDLFAVNATVVTGTADTAQDGDIVLTLGQKDALHGFDEETYLMDVSGKVQITATHATGAYWGTRSVLQALKLSGDKTIAQGLAKDYPEFKLRGFMLDVGRKPMSMVQLKNFAKNMSWYKLNDFHVHLSDNLIFMENYTIKQEEIEKAWDAYDGFRLESDMKGKQTQRPLASPDYHYKKQEFGDFIKECRNYGISVVPEIDVPAHALSFTKILKEEDPSYVLNKVGTFNGKTRPWIDHVDITNPKAVARVKDLFREYITSTEQAFGDAETVVHIGADEYYDKKSAYQKFLKEMIEFITQEMGRKVRVWGSLSTMGHNNFTKQDTHGAQMGVWDAGWARPKEMYDLGFNLINVLGNQVYIVPGNGGIGGYKDYLQPSHLYANWTPNNFSGTVIPASDAQMLGGSFALWQDNIDTNACGLDEQDTFDRFYDALPALSVKMWGEGGDGLDRTDFNKFRADSEKIDLAPNTDPYYGVEKKENTTDYAKYLFADETDISGNDRTLQLHGAEVKDGVLSLKGGECYAETGMDKLSWNNTISFKVKKVNDVNGEEILFESDHAYGDYAIKALPGSAKGKWKLGFSRELYDYTFDHDLPVGEWIDVAIVSNQQKTTLVVGSEEIQAVGVFKSKPGSNSNFKGVEGIMNSSFCLPAARIGSKKHAFVGEIDNVKFAESKASPVTEGLYDIPVEQYKTVTAGSTETSYPSAAAQAIDKDAGTLWHSAWGGCNPEDGWIQIELKQAQQVSGFRYLPRAAGSKNGVITKYKIETSMTGNDGDWQEGKTGTWNSMNDRTWHVATFAAREAKFIRLTALESGSDSNKRFVSAAEIRAVRPQSLETAEVTLDAEYPLVKGKAEPKPEVVLEGYTLREGADYTLSYTNNTTAGATATLTITGAGVYTGKIDREFKVLPGQDGGSSNGSGSGSTPMYVVNFNTNGGSALSLVRLMKGETLDLSRYVPTREGYTFAGWYLDAALTRPVTSIKMKESLTVYARWTKNGETPHHNDLPFTDVKPEDWYYGAVKDVYEHGLMFGTESTKFGPQTTMTRGMVVTILHRLAGEPAAAAPHFDDVAAGAYYAKAVGWAQEKGIAAGYDAKTFAPDDKITREQMAAILHRYAKVMGMDMTGAEELTRFGDAAKVSDYAAEAMKWAVGKKLVSGDNNLMLHPADSATRAETASILSRFAQMTKK